MKEDQKEMSSSSCWLGTIRFLILTGCLIQILIILVILGAATSQHSSNLVGYGALALYSIEPLLGLYGVITKNRLAVRYFSILISLVCIIFLVALILLKKTHVDEEMEVEFTHFMTNYSWPSNTESPLDLYQWFYHCCGFQTYKEWDKYRPKSEPNNTYPSTCCGQLTTTTCNMNDKSFYSRPCSDRFYLTTRIVGFVVIFIFAVLALLAQQLADELDKQANGEPSQSSIEVENA